MKILSLDRLVGHGRSIGENFEILCLELAKTIAGSSFACYRNLPPDKGVDIFAEDKIGTIYAYQCKAYSTFSSALISSLKDSIETANRGFEKKPWHIYILMIPFVPTANQREKLEDVLKICKAKTYICDGDEIESRLLDYPNLITRFFPSLTVIIPPNTGELIFKIDEKSKTIRFHLQSIRTQQRIPLRVSVDLTVGGLINFLNTTLRLPSSRKPMYQFNDPQNMPPEWYAIAVMNINSVFRLVLKPKAIEGFGPCKNIACSCITCPAVKSKPRLLAHFIRKRRLPLNLMGI